LPERSTRVVPSPHRVGETQLHRLRPSEDPAIGILVENLRFHVAAFDDGGLELGQDDLSRENIMRQAANLKDLELPMLLPGIRLKTSPTDYFPIQAMRLQRFTGETWQLFGDTIGGD